VTQNPAIKIRVGLVDDDLSVRRALDRLLRTHGYLCVSYESAEAALSDPDFLQMNCVILDVQLGGMNGFALGQRLHSLGLDMPQIFITAHAKSDFPQHSQETAILVKPFDESQLISLIEDATGPNNSESGRLS
jgi:FixJ family two-component response regulator